MFPRRSYCGVRSEIKDWGQSFVQGGKRVRMSVSGSVRSSSAFSAAHQHSAQRINILRENNEQRSSSTFSAAHQHSSQRINILGENNEQRTTNNEQEAYVDHQHSRRLINIFHGASTFTPQLINILGEERIMDNGQWSSTRTAAG